MTDRYLPLREARKVVLEGHRVRQGYTSDEYSQVIERDRALAARYFDDNPDVIDEVDEMAREHFERILKTRYLNLFGVVGEIEFTADGRVDWPKLFITSEQH